VEPCSQPELREIELQLCDHFKPTRCEKTVSKRKALTAPEGCLTEERQGRREKRKGMQHR